jgi:peptidoglycan/xylan/chitin deacetylase (PgdA/CDA1 family)
MMMRVSDLLRHVFAQALTVCGCALLFVSHVAAQAPQSATSAALTLSRPPIAPLATKPISMTPPAKQEHARREPLSTRNVFHVFTYHDVYSSFDAARAVGDTGATTVEDMARQFSWLRDNGYTVVSMQQVLDARSGGKPLPAKSVMITFDDGYKSFHTHVLPVLKLFNYPVTLAVISAWIDDPANAQIEYELSRTVASQFMNWDEIRDCVDSGLVEIASHSHDLHHGVQGNPQGNKQPAVITRRYDPTSNTYESEAAYAARIRTDLARNSDVIAARLGKRPRIVVWPYGAHNETARQIAAQLGMPIGFALAHGPNSNETSLAEIRRDLISNDSTPYSIAAAMRSTEVFTQRAITIDLASELSEYSTDNETSLSAVLDRVRLLRPTMVIVRDDARNNRANGRGAVSFPNSLLRMRTNLLNRFAWQMRTRAGVRVLVDDPSVGLNERDRTTLLSELGRYNHFAGLVRGSDAVFSPKADAGFTAIEANQPGFESVYRVNLGVACGEALPRAEESKVRTAQNAAFNQWREAVAHNDWVLLRVRADDPSKCTLKWWQALAEIAATAADWQQRTIIELDNDLAAPDDAKHIVKPLLNAYAAGFRHYGYANDNARNNRPALDVVKRAISIEYHPVQR